MCSFGLRVKLVKHLTLSVASVSCLVYSIEFNIMLYYNKISSLFLIVIELYSLSIIGTSVTACFSCYIFDTGSVETSLYQLFLVIQAVCSI